MEKYRIKVVKGIFAGYTGVLGMGRQFVNGASVEELPTLEAQMIAAEGTTYVIDQDGNFVKDEQGRPYLVTPGAMPFPDTLGVSFISKVQEKDVEAKPVQKTEEPQTASVVDEHKEQPEESANYTREELEAIADRAGLRGLREIGESLGVKGKSIPELIEKILNKQA